MSTEPTATPASKPDSTHPASTAGVDDAPASAAAHAGKLISNNAMISDMRLTYKLLK